MAVEPSFVVSIIGPSNTLCYCELNSSNGLSRAKLLLVKPVSTSVQATGAFLCVGII